MVDQVLVVSEETASVLMNLRPDFVLCIERTLMNRPEGKENEDGIAKFQIQKRLPFKT